MALIFLKNASTNKSFRSFQDLEIGTYIITEFSKVETKFGTKIRIDIGDYLVNLPQRYTEGMTQEYLDELNRTRMLMRYHGKDPKKNNK